MKHILERHHPDYYNADADLAKRKENTTFFESKITVEDITNIIDNREDILRRIVNNGG